MCDTGSSLEKRIASASEEANALVLYFARHCPEASEEDAARAYNGLVKALSAVQETNDEASYQTLMEAYDKLAYYTYRDHEVHGKSILDTTRPAGKGIRRIWDDKRVRPVTLGIAFFLLALIFEFSEEMVRVNQVKNPIMLTFINSCVDLLVPVAWGALGACAALAKTVSDLLSAMSYEENRMHGLVPRIFLGAALALVLNVFVFVESDTNGNGSTLGEFGPIAGAFLAGLFVQHIYGVFENMMERIATSIIPPPSKARTTSASRHDDRNE